MKIKNIIIALVVTFVGFSAQAQDTSKSKLVKQNKNAKYVTEVNGNCEQCQKRIQKAAYAVDGVKSAIWNGKPLNKAWLYYDVLMKGGELVLTMSSQPNKNWGVSSPPPSVQ